MPVRFLLAVIVCAVAGAQTPTFQSGVSQVHVDVEVLSGGRPVTQLVAQYFLGSGQRRSAAGGARLAE
jgi:hypothetical protein